MEKEFAEKIQHWLDLPLSERNLEEGALWALQLNRNRYLYNNAIARPRYYADKIEYELRKYLRFYLDEQTAGTVEKMEKKILPAVAQTLKEEEEEDDDDEEPASKKFRRGRRPDHEDLPKEIQNIWKDNGEVYFKMKALHEKLKRMYEARPCDRYELLKELEHQFKIYRDNWTRYDNYDPAKMPLHKKEEQPRDLAKEVAAARKYVSTNSKKLEQALEEKDTKKVDKWLPRIQNKIDFLVKEGQTFDAVYQKKLESFGFTFQ